MDIVKNLVNVDAKLDGMVKIVTNAIHIRDVRMEIVDALGNAIASKFTCVKEKYFINEIIFIISRPGYGGMICDEGK